MPATCGHRHSPLCMTSSGQFCHKCRWGGSFSFLVPTGLSSCCTGEASVSRDLKSRSPSHRFWLFCIAGRCISSDSRNIGPGQCGKRLFFSACLDTFWMLHPLPGFFFCYFLKSKADTSGAWCASTHLSLFALLIPPVVELHRGCQMN